jgi:uncharacterized protein
MDRLIWDDGNWPKCGKHGVSQSEIEHVLADPATTIVIDPFEAEERYRAIGRTGDGRYVFLVFAYRGEAKRPISARYMHDREIRRYEIDNR